MMLVNEQDALRPIKRRFLSRPLQTFMYNIIKLHAYIHMRVNACKVHTYMQYLHTRLHRPMVKCRQFGKGRQDIKTWQIDRQLYRQAQLIEGERMLERRVL